MSDILWTFSYFIIFVTDLENDKIKITCDDDLKFFLEESPCQKLIFDFNPATESELSRKRSCSVIGDEANESSKKIRKQLQQIDLSSDSSFMDTDDDDEDLSGEASSSLDTSNNSSVNNVSQQLLDEMIPSTSAAALRNDMKSPNVKIISVDIIKPMEEEAAVETLGTADESQNAPKESNQSEDQETIEIPDENGNEVQVIDDQEVAANIEVSTTQENQSQKQSLPEKNRIVISDSSDDDEPQDNTNNNRRNSEGPSCSAYSFANVNGNSFESRSSFRGGRHRHEHRFRRNVSFSDDNERRGQHHRGRHSFQDQLPRDYFRTIHAENMRQIHRNAEAARESAARAREMAFENAARARDMAMENVARARDMATRAARASTSAIPDIMQNFRAHFQPLFSVNDINQHVFSNFGRR